MGLLKLLITILLLGIITAGLLPFLLDFITPWVPAPVLEDQWWGRGKVPPVGKFPKDDPTIRKFTVKFENSVIEDLKERLNKTRFHEPLDNVEFQYGFHSEMLKRVVDYWLNDYHFKKQETFLNSFPHFKTEIEGIDVHFIRVVPKMGNKKVKVIPLLMVHGWPGSVVEFYKAIPLLTTPRPDQDFVFEVICPSIPGYGFSEAPHQPGFSPMAAARVFHKLMTRLGHQKFYTNGGDWGALITQVMAATYPENVLGFHANLIFVLNPPLKPTLIKYVGSLFPDLFFDKKDQEKLYPLFKHFSYAMREMGYCHIQATKPDTVGSGLMDSPAGLAAYIMEKFSTWTNEAGMHAKDGDLLKKFTMDELLNNVMIYWVTGTITSSQRLYKEFFSNQMLNYNYDRVKIKVPSAIAEFRHELARYPRLLTEFHFTNLVQFSEYNDGGHFACFELPKIYTDDIWKFVSTVQNLPKEKPKTDL